MLIKVGYSPNKHECGAHAPWVLAPGHKNNIDDNITYQLELGCVGVICVCLSQGQQTTCRNIIGAYGYALMDRNFDVEKRQNHA